MNYIKQLQTNLSEQEIKHQAMIERMYELRAHLSLSKYNAVQSDGSRGDWISTADVNRWIDYIKGE